MEGAKKMDVARMLVMALLSLVLFTTPALAGSTVSESLADADRVCSHDVDCTVVMTACCSCTLAAVSAEREAEVRSRIEAELKCSEACPISCAAPAVQCVAGLCELVSETETVSPGEEE